MEDMPDLSHLTPEERRHIESVMMRQKQEEEHQNEIMRRKQNEVQVLEDTISRARTERLKNAGVDLDVTCEICVKTKFADGVGHICNYCNVRCCARCGGKVSLRSNKIIWVCILCRKKQELLSKSGQWINKSNIGGTDNAMLRRMQEDMQSMMPAGIIVDQTQDKRPKLERAHSAVEKENLPLLQRSGSLLRRQYSHQDQITGRRLSTSDRGVEISITPNSRTLPTPRVAPYQAQETPRHPAAYPDDDPSLYHGELEGLMRQNASYQRQRQIYQNSDIPMVYGHQGIDQSDGVRAPMHPVSQQQQHHQLHPCHPQGQTQQGQRSFSSSEEERSTPECASDEHDDREHGKGYYEESSHNGHDQSEPMMSIVYNGHNRDAPRTEETFARRNFRRNSDEWQADARRFTERRGKKTVRFHGGTSTGGGSQEDWYWEADRQGSQDSATKDSGIDTSSTFTSSEDSNKGDLPKHPSPWQVSSDGHKLIGHMVLRKSSQGPGTSNSSILGLKVVGGKLLEDGSMGAIIEKVKKGSPADIEGQLRSGDEVLQWNNRPLQGKSFQDVSDVIAMSRNEGQVELVVSRNLTASTSALSIMGDKTSTGHQQDMSSTPDFGSPNSSGSGLAHMPTSRYSAQAQWRQKHDATLPQQPHHKELYDVRSNKPSVLVTSPGSPDLYAQGRVSSRHFRPHVASQQVGGNSVGGRLQIKLNFDTSTLQLAVTLVCATGLTPRNNGQQRSSYAKMYLLPDRSEKSKKRTKTLANTNEPRWDQTFVYSGIRWSELRQRSLEITIWDYGRYGANDFLGEIILNLAASTLNDDPEWHYLMAHEEHRQTSCYQDTTDDIVTTPGDCHLSPPSTTSRLSDSDTSECDITDCDGSREHRRTADGASISSIGSSSRFHNTPPNYKRHYSSPPPEKELCVDGEHRSRRDMSPQGRKRAALMGSREQPASISGYQHYRKDEPHRTAILSHRSHSAAPMDSSSLRYRRRSQSPSGHRSLSPPDHRSMPFSSAYLPARFGSRSATATPTGSPKKRQLPQIPANLHAALKERVAHDLEERARFIRHRNRPINTIYRCGVGGWDRRFSGLSDSDLPSMGHEIHSLSHGHVHRMPRIRRGHMSPEKDILADLGDSDMESIASVTSSAFSTQSERPRGSRGLIDYASPSGSYDKPSRYPIDDNERRNGSVKRGQFARSFSNAEAPADENVDGSLSDTAVGLHVEENSRRGRKNSPNNKKNSIGSREVGGGGSGGIGGSGVVGGSSGGSIGIVQYQPALGKKSNSTSQLSAQPWFFFFLFVVCIMTNTNRRTAPSECSAGSDGVGGGIGGNSSGSVTLGQNLPGWGPVTTSTSGRKRNSTPSTIQRSQEVMPSCQPRAATSSPSRARQTPSSACPSDSVGSLNSISNSDGSSWSPNLRVAGDSSQLNEFIEGLGPGQLVGRQVLGAASLGDIQLSLSNTKGYLEVEVVRARELQPRRGSKTLPAPYVKVYLVSGKKCIAKAKTTTARKTLEPFYQQPLAFRENFRGCILQVTVWGDYGRLEGKKVFMGVAQIMLDNLNLNEMVFGWYKLFGTTSLVSGPPSIGLSRRSSAASLESLKF
ncbi:PREDICTED: regulating synaptic membrane exocytosis protein 1 [Ceratosolen solmsi marchali]|uniref:Regulating synaptic membrane exocytosis protein 1 n=1 Tax=Ceratosolen solmsi marchali TaxID=326594 RepID=A0AAJ7DZ23_9HYME|nr:PREDICTED: regulating synaptic membrane exocytosis protein 1 [Ceratosolen solmsi marchali]